MAGLTPLQATGMFAPLLRKSKKIGPFKAHTQRIVSLTGL